IAAARLCATIAHEGWGLTATAVASLGPARRLTAEELATVVAVALIGTIWIRIRLGRNLGSTVVAQGIWIALGLLTILVVAGIIAPYHQRIPFLNLPPIAHARRDAPPSPALPVAPVRGADRPCPP